MHAKCWRLGVPVVMVALAVLLCGTQVQGGKDKDEVGKAEDFKGKTFDLKEKAKASITLLFPSGKEATVTVRSEKKTDVHLFIYDAKKKLVEKDDSPGPSCDIKFTPKESGKYTLVVENLGPGENSSTLKVAYKK
jgi:hypothetical protein